MRTSLKSFFTLLFIAGLSVTIFAQKGNEIVHEKPNVPVDESTKKITYTKVVNAEGKSDILFRKGLDWFNKYYKNPTNVIQQKDPNAAKIVGKARIKILNPPDKKGVETMKGIVLYTITCEFKEGRFKYMVTDINLKSTSYFACENWLDEDSKTYSQVYNYFLKQVDEQIKETVANLEAHMTQAAEKKEEDW